MTKGTPSQGRRNKKVHRDCRRCGRHTYHMTKKTCAACGYGYSSRIKAFAWQWKTVTRDKRRF